MNQPLNARANGSRISEIDLVRAFAIIGVLAVHATSFATTEMLSDSASYPVYNFINIFMKYGTPVFLFLSSFVLFRNYYPRPISKQTLVSFYRKRFVHIIIPYLVFSTIYYIAWAVTREPSEQPANWLTDFAEKLASGTAYAHLYFVFISAKFYLLFPLVLWTLKKIPKLVPWCIPIGFAVQWGFYVLGEWVHIPHAANWAFSYFSFYMLGVYLGIRFEALRALLAAFAKRRALYYRALTAVLWCVWLATGIGHSLIWYKLRTAAETLPPPYVYSLFWNGYAFLSALVFMQAAFYLQYKRKNSFLLRQLRKLGTLSFGVYLLHPLLLAIYRELKPAALSQAGWHIWYAGGFILALFGTAFIVSLSHRYLPFAWLFFGKNERGTKPADSSNSPAEHIVSGNKIGLR